MFVIVLWLDVSCETLVECICDIMFSLKWVAVTHQDVSCETLNGVARFALAVLPRSPYKGVIQMYGFVALLSLAYV